MHAPVQYSCLTASGRAAVNQLHICYQHVPSACRLRLHGSRWKPTGRWKCRPSTCASASPGSSDGTIKSLESILGSNDSIDEDERRPPNKAETDRAAPSGGRKAEAGARRVRPLYVYVIYYCFIVVYLAAAWLQATDGDLAASTLIDGLVNDHLAVAAGQVPRLATSGFVCESPLELFMELATLLTVGAEAEALLGYSLFWAVYWFSNLGGGLADAALSELPITYGPANAAAGIVGALVAYYARNWGLEEQLDEARKAVRKRRQQLLDGLGSGSSIDGEEEKERDQTRRQGRGKGPSSNLDSVEEAEAEVEVLPLLSFKFSARLTAQARGLLNVLVALVVAGQGLLEFGGASTSASWIGLNAAFWTGLVVTYWAGPQYEVQVGTATGPTEGQTGADDEAADSDGLTVVDVCPLARRQLSLGGYAAGLAVLIFVWLAWMDVDI